MGRTNPNFGADKPTLLIGMSGPPRSGKNTIAEHLAAVIEDRHGIQSQLLTLSTPMREVVYAMLGIEYSEAHYERCKDFPQEDFGGRSIRQAMIAFTEEHVKPSYGAGFWAKSLLGRMWDPRPRVLIITDMGFDEEVEVFSLHFGVKNTFYPQIVRPGQSFVGDSRNYVGAAGRWTTIVNDEDIPTAARRAYGRLVNQFGWKFD